MYSGRQVACLPWYRFEPSLWGKLRGNWKWNKKRFKLSSVDKVTHLKKKKKHHFARFKLIFSASLSSNQPKQPLIMSERVQNSETLLLVTQWGGPLISVRRHHSWLTALMEMYTADEPWKICLFSGDWPCLLQHAMANTRPHKETARETSQTDTDILSTTCLFSWRPAH